jgi:hypothetical protein
MGEQIEVNELYVDGDVRSGSVVGECPEPEQGIVAVHVLPTDGDGSPDGTPYVSVYLSPVDAAIFGTRVIAAARTAIREISDA